MPFSSYSATVEPHEVVMSSEIVPTGSAPSTSALAIASAMIWEAAS